MFSSSQLKKQSQICCTHVRLLPPPSLASYLSKPTD
jgi:hypothetical protein